MIHTKNFVSELMIGMDRLEEYVDEESPYTERNNLQKEPIQEDITEHFPSPLFFNTSKIIPSK